MSAGRRANISANMTRIAENSDSASPETDAWPRSATARVLMIRTGNST